MRMPQLFAAPRHHWTGSHQLQKIHCPWCATPIDQIITWTQPPLFSHGGYGAATQTEVKTCRCGLTMVASIASVSPRPYRIVATNAS